MDALVLSLSLFLPWGHGQLLLFFFGNGLGLEGCELDLQLIYWEGEELSSKDDFGGRHLGRVEEARVRTIEG